MAELHKNTCLEENHLTDQGCVSRWRTLQLTQCYLADKNHMLHHIQHGGREAL